MIGEEEREKNQDEGTLVTTHSLWKNKGIVHTEKKRNNRKKQKVCVSMNIESHIHTYTHTYTLCIYETSRKNKENKERIRQAFSE